MALCLEGKIPVDANDLSPKEATEMSRDIKYIGMDVHKEATVIAVRNGSGKLVMESIVETKASSILQFIHGLRGELHYQFGKMLEQSLRERPATEEKVHGFLAIACDDDVVRQRPLFQSMQGKIHIVLIVFHNSMSSFPEFMIGLQP
jgi:hypothetical protein